MEGIWTRIALRAWVVVILLFLFIPIVLIFFYAFNTSIIESWHIPGLTTRWFGATWDEENVRSALWLSVMAALGASAIELVLGCSLAYAVQRCHVIVRA